MTYISTCPKCGSTNIYYDAAKDEYLCLNCRHKWQKEGMGLRELVEKYRSPLEKRVTEEMQQIIKKHGVGYKSDLGYMEFPRPEVSSSQFRIIAAEVEQKLKELDYDWYDVFEHSIVIDFPGEKKAYEEWERMGKPSSHTSSPEAKYGTEELLNFVKSQIKDEEKAIEEYKKGAKAAFEVNRPDIGSIFQDIALDEQKHKSLLETVRWKLE